MSEQARLEELSALVDDELPAVKRQRALDQLTASPALRERWSRYHLIGAVMRGEANAGRDVSGAVRLAIQSEPAALSRRAGRRSAIGPLPGLAIAASVAAVTVVALRLLLSDAGGPDTGSLEVALDSTRRATQPVFTVPASETFRPAPFAGGPLQNVAVGGEPQAGAQQSGPPKLDPELRARLSRYLVDHTESVHPGIRGVFPYVALVSGRSR